MGKIEQNVTRDLVSLDGSTPCREAARLMAEKKIGAVGVKRGGKTVGLVTERDLVAQVIAPGKSCEVPIAELMRRDLPTVGPDASEFEVSDLMRDHYTRHLLVEQGGNVIGIISMRDVIRQMLSEKQFLIDQLEVYISGR
jgi:signal-transduction protein with cAMP-binding, CBS, and nucleotidyltransferase domain